MGVNTTITDDKVNTDVFYNIQHANADWNWNVRAVCYMWYLFYHTEHNMCNKCKCFKDIEHNFNKSSFYSGLNLHSNLPWTMDLCEVALDSSIVR